MSRSAALLAAALIIGGCAAGTSNGFTAQRPGGWQDRTDTAETRTGTDFEVVWEGPAVDDVLPTLTVARIEATDGLEVAARRARIAVDRRFDEADPTKPVDAELAGETALRFDYRTGDKRSRYLTAKRGKHIYAVTVQAAAGGFDRALRIFDAYVDSWRWD